MKSLEIFIYKVKIQGKKCSDCPSALAIWKAKLAGTNSKIILHGPTDTGKPYISIGS